MGLTFYSAISAYHRQHANHDSASSVWHGQPKQKEFLLSNCDELLFGGSAGGSKTESLLVYAAGHVKDTKGFRPNTSPNYSALILRRTQPELEELIMRAKVLFPKLVPGIEYNEQKHIFWLPEGGFILFGQCERDISVEKYLGREYAHIAIDELGLFKTNYVWTMLKARNRCKDHRIHCTMRGTCNPGPAWLLDYFPIGEGDITKTDTKIINNRATTYGFIPSRLSDNKYLGDDYRSKLEALPEDLRDAFLNGKWNCYAIKGAIYEDEYRAWTANDRIGYVPFTVGFPIDLALDRGHADACAVVCCQLIGNDVKVIKSWEESRSNAHKTVDNIRKYLDTIQATLGRIFLPHDGRNQNYEATESTEAIFRQAFPGHVPECLKAENVQVRIDRVRHFAPRIAFDSTEAQTVLTAVRQYKREYNSRLNVFTEPMHDENSHTADAFGYLIKGVADNTFKDTSKYRKLLSAGW